jgi:hypothetical protein
LTARAWFAIFASVNLSQIAATSEAPPIALDRAGCFRCGADLIPGLNTDFCSLDCELLHDFEHPMPGPASYGRPEATP